MRWQFKNLVFLWDSELWHKTAQSFTAIKREAMKTRVNAHPQKILPGWAIALKTT